LYLVGKTALLTVERGIPGVELTKNARFLAQILAFLGNK
jgi:hypothetical protein